MTREQAIAAAQERNLAAHAATGDLDSIWVEVHVGAGEWDIALAEKAPRPLWRRVTRELVEFVLEPDPTQGPLLPDPPARTWRLRRRREPGAR